MESVSTQRGALAVSARIAELAIAAAIYLVLARASLSFASLNASATPVWPPTGLAIALLLVRGNAMLAAVFIGAFAANFMTTPSLLTSAAIAAGNSIEAIIATVLLQRWAGGDRVFESPIGVGRFALIVIVAAAPVAASVGVLTLIGTGFAAMGDALELWITWWLGDVGGAILAAPALVLWARAALGQDSRLLRPAAFAAFGAAALIGLLAFSPLTPAPEAIRGALAFLAILPLLWSALWLGLRDTATTALILSSFAIWGAVSGSSPFQQPTLNASLLLLIAFIIAATLPSLALAAERRESLETLNQTRAELVQAQKLEALGQLTGGVAHDFNNLLASIEGGLRLLSRQDEERAKTLALVHENLERGAALTRQLLAFARREPLVAEIVYLNQVMDSARSLIAQSLRETVSVVVTVTPGVWPVKVERNQLELALLNLALNARDAMADGGELRIQVENVVSAGGRNEVSISVADTGAGMEADVLARAFEPFYSTKPAGKGTGLGLAQVYSFAKQAGGDAHIESAPGAGTTVTITLPRAS